MKQQKMSRGGSPSYHHQCGYQASSYRSSSSRPRGSTMAARKSSDSGLGSCINTSNPFYKSTTFTTSPRSSPRKPVATVSPIATTNAARRRLPTSGSSGNASVYSTYSSIRRRPPSFVLTLLYYNKNFY